MFSTLDEPSYPRYHKNNIRKEADHMVKRESYMKRIRPFLGNDLV